MIRPAGRLAVAFLALCALAAPAMAATERLGNFEAWSAYKSVDDKGVSVCFMASEPSEAKGNYTNRGDIFALVSHRPAEQLRDEVSFVAGYSYKDGSTVEVLVDTDKYELRLIKEDTAWTASPDVDQELVQAMIRGATMTVIGTSSRGTLTTDTYSLKGFTAAYNAITTGCGL